MGNTLSCCVSPESSPKLPSRQPAERLEEFQTSTEVSDDNTVPYLQHISDREVPDGRCPLTFPQPGHVPVASVLAGCSLPVC